MNKFRDGIDVTEKRISSTEDTVTPQLKDTKELKYIIKDPQQKLLYLGKKDKEVSDCATCIKWILENRGAEIFSKIEFA